MSDYNFEDENDIFGETVRIDDINKKIQEYEKEDGQPVPPEEPFGWIENGQASLKRPQGERNEDKEDKTEEIPASRRPAPAPGGTKPPKRDRDGDNKRLVIIAVLAGIIVFVCVFIVVWVSSMNNGVDNSKFDNPNDIADDLKQEVYDYALVKNVNTSNEISLYDIEDNKDYSVRVNDNTIYKSYRPGRFTFADIKIGDLLKIKSDASNVAQEIEISQDTWTLEHATKAELDTEKKTIRIGENEYSYTDQTIFQYDGKLLEASKIEDVDVLTVNGYDETVWSVFVEEYHGYIDILNKDSIEEGTIEIDGGEPVGLKDADKIVVSGGPHKIIIKGSNIETYNADIYVINNERFEVDLSNTQAKTGVVVITANVDGFNLFVNDSQVSDPYKPLVLPLGQYKIRVEKQGYHTWESDIALSEPSKEVNVLLEEEIKMGELLLATNPSGGDVYVDGQLVGASPIQATLPYGEHRIMVKKDGYEDFSGPVIIEKSTTTVSVLLKEAAN